MAFFDDQTELIRALFADSVASGVAEHSWAGLLRRLAEVTQADGAALSVHKMSDELGHWRHGDAGGISLQLRQKMRTDRVYDGETLPAVDLKPGYVRALKVRVEMSTHACLWVWRGMHRKDFRSVDVIPWAQSYQPVKTKSLARFAALLSTTQAQIETD